jgi:hypothetical protein
VVKNLLDRGAFSVLYGESGCGKTFLALDLAWHIALGMDWFGLRVRQGPVYYLGAEGGAGGLSKRLAALYAHHGTNAGDAPLYPFVGSADLRDPAADTAPLIAEMKAIKAVCVMTDTLSRVMAGGNENGPEDMGAFVANVDRIRNETGAHVLSVHHSGKDAARGARGHSLLRAATDAEMEVASGCVSITKSRDYPDGGAFNFRLQSVDLGRDKDGDPLSSCVVIPIEGVAAKARKATKLPRSAQLALHALVDAIDRGGSVPPASNHIPANVKAVSYDIWREYAYSRGISGSEDPGARQKAFKRAVETLVAEKVAAMWNGQCWPCRT